MAIQSGSGQTEAKLEVVHKEIKAKMGDLKEVMEKEQKEKEGVFKSTMEMISNVVEEIKKDMTEERRNREMNK